MTAGKRSRPGRPDRSESHHDETAEELLIWGIHPVMEALETKPGNIHEVFVLKERHGSKIAQLVDLTRRLGLKLRFGARLPAGIPAGASHQGVAARMTPFATVTLDELLDRMGRLHAPPFLLVADSILDPYNLGAIIRSSVAAGVQGLIVPKDRAAPLSGTAAKASAGAIAHMEVCRVTNLTAAILTLQKAGIWVYGLVKQTDRTIHATDLTGPLCLVVGGEEKGVRPRIREACDGLLTIPMHGPLDSLNASAAAAIALFEAARQRQNANLPGG